MHTVFLCAPLMAMALSTAAAQREMSPAFGPYVNLKPEDFAEAKSFWLTDRVVGTDYVDLL